MRSRGHSAAERLAASKERDSGQQFGRLRHSGPDRGVRNGWRVGPALLRLHIGELVAKSRNPGAGKQSRHRFEKWVSHTGASSMGHDVEMSHVVSKLQQPTDTAVIELDGDRFGGWQSHDLAA